MSQVVEIYSDGACRGNPGPGSWGVVLRYGRHEKQLFGGERETTNNRMELMAVIRGLQSLKKQSLVRVTTDSQYVKNGITTWIHGWKRNGWKTANRKPVKNQDLWIEINDLAADREIDWRWVKGHAGHDGNERADELARRGVAGV